MELNEQFKQVILDVIDLTVVKCHNGKSTQQIKDEIITIMEASCQTADRS